MEVYDAAYYASGCGPIPYGKHPHWLALFGQLADQIVTTIKPARVMDAGCAMGLLVEALRERGVEAYGLDISAYAISQTTAAVRPYCQQGSILHPFGQQYDLISCIEVLEHLTESDGLTAIANICAHTDVVIFSSSPNDLTEPTHQNVQPPRYWAHAFAAHGFYRDLSVDVGMLAPWAVCLRRGHGPQDARWLGYEDALVAQAIALQLLRNEHMQLQTEHAHYKSLAEGYANGRLMRMLRNVHRLAGRT
jgi:Methyltransferase domain